MRVIDSPGTSGFTLAVSSLPIDPLLHQITASLARTPRLVQRAPPGAGKTTRVPAALLDAGLAGGQQVVVLEPRRIAARHRRVRIRANPAKAPAIVDHARRDALAAHQHRSQPAPPANVFVALGGLPGIEAR